MHNLAHVWRFVYRTPWAILPEKLEEILAFLELREAGVELTAEERAARMGPPQRRSSQIAGRIGVLPLFGVIVQRAGMVSDWSGGTSTQAFARDLRQMVEDPQIDAILLDVDSPGGSVYGVPELAAEIFDARSRKPVSAIANSRAASAAYWLASQASELSVTPSGDVGSVGVYAMHSDFSKAYEAAGVKISFISAGKFKVEANPYEPLSDEARGAIQASVNGIYSMFVADVARGRGVGVEEVRTGFGEGREIDAPQALELGMVDRVETFDQALGRIAGEVVASKAQGSVAAGAAAVAMPAELAQERDRLRRRLEVEDKL